MKTPPLSRTAAILNILTTTYPGKTVFQRSELHAAAASAGTETYPELLKPAFKVKRGVYNLATLLSTSTSATTNEILPTMPYVQPVPPLKAAPVMKLAAQISSTVNLDGYIPSKDSTYVRWGFYDDVSAVIKSEAFFPLFISGLSGNGKTMMVEQACAALNREYIRVQISPETDEDDLIGGFRLLNGETVFAKGPVIKAMERGAVLCLDEIDRGTNKLMCLQGVLEGKPVLIKKTGEVIMPAPGFTIIATANTKGKGSDDGRFVAATIIDEAFLERFVATLEQPYPTLSTERKIVLKHFEKFHNLNSVSEDFAERLVMWSEVIRKTFAEDAVDELISTRRLCHIAQTFSVFGDKMKAIDLCISRFDADTKSAFLDLYTKIDASITGPESANVTPSTGVTPFVTSNPS